MKNITQMQILIADIEQQASAIGYELTSQPIPRRGVIEASFARLVALSTYFHRQLTDTIPCPPNTESSHQPKQSAAPASVSSLVSRSVTVK